MEQIDEDENEMKKKTIKIVATTSLRPNAVDQSDSDSDYYAAGKNLGLS